MIKQGRSGNGRLRKLAISAVIMMQCAAIIAPISFRAYAQEAPPADPAAVGPVPCVAPANVARPTGSDGSTYTWNCESGLWENPYYTFNPDTRRKTARHAPQHTFNTTRNLWEVREWVYIPPANEYQLRVTSTYAPAPEPQPAVIENTGPDSTNGITNGGGSISNTGPGSTNTIDGTNGTIGTTGTDSSNAISLDNSGQSTGVNLGLTASITNDVNSTATSGNANVLQNTTGGNALTGDAAAMANILNMLQSSWGWNGGQTPSIYTADIQGDYKGDILINPSLLGVSSGGCNCGDLTVVSNADMSITNNVDLLAKSGDATVSGNTTGGNASTGNATALANIINMISSSIHAGDSFLGILNIHGNFEGDVLVAQDVIDELIAANVPTTQITMCGCDATAEFTDNQTINNNVNATATSGAASVHNNTTGGNATTGSADTSITVFNLTGRQVVGQNALLVFVNVLGEWVGFITDAPGATAAAFGGGLTQNSMLPMSANGDTDYDVSTDMSITNNINVTAETGDAEVSNNTRGGNAGTGDAKAAANVSNIMNSSFSLTGWFGLLFINVLGNWFGSFGVDTPYGNTTLPPIGSTAGVPSVAAAQTTNTSNSASARRQPSNVRVFAATLTSGDNGQVVLSDATETTPNSSQSENFGGSSSSNQNAVIGWTLLAVGTGFILYFFRRRQQPGL